MLVLLLALLSSIAVSVHAQPPCSTSTTGLPTSSGPYTVSNATFTSDIVSAWPEYSVGQSAIAYTVAPLTDLSGVSYPAGSWVWWGTQAPVTISQTQGQTWGLLNNSGSDYTLGLGNALCAHRASYNRFYVLGDTVSGTQTSSSFIYASNNGEAWTNVITAATLAAWTSRNLQQTGCAVDIHDNVYSLGEDDVWMSSNQGVAWTNVTTGSMYTARSSFGYGIFSASYGDVMVVVAGSAGVPTSYGPSQRDVWVSQTGGTSWVQQTATAPWSGRTDPNIAISSSGAMVLQGGRSYTTQQVWLSDAWLSLDGGATWTLLNGDTALNRSASAVVFDASGYLYLFGGESAPNYNWNKDGWKSSYALANIQSWSAAAAQQAPVIPAGFSACTPYYNILSQAPSSPSSSGGSVAASSSSSVATAASSASSSAAAASSSAATSASAAASSSAAASATSSMASMTGSGPQPCSTSTTGLPTSSGPYTVSNATFTSDIVSAWPEYSVGQSAIAYTVAPLTDLSGVSYPAGSWVWWGTQAPVTISQTQGQTWGLLNNSGSDYTLGLGNALCAHRASYNRFYVLGDTVSGTQTSSSFIYASNNGEAWTNVITAATLAAWTSRNLQQTGCAVDIHDNVYSLGEDDVWMSSNQGVAWTNVTTGSMYTARSSFGYGIFSASYGDVMVVVAGSAGVPTSYGPSQRDVWVSQTGGTSWVQQTATAPWSGRTDPNIAISSSGAMVLQGGRSYTTQQVWLSDAWLSLDGGATWTLLNGDTALNRSASAVVFDASGYLYLFGGESAPNYNWNKDGWKSSYALANIQSWSAAAAQQAPVIPAGFSACTPYYNILSQAPSSPSSSGGSVAASSSSSVATAASSASSSAAAASSSAATSASAAASSSVTSTSAMTAVASSTTAAPTSTFASSSSLTSAAVNPTSAASSAPSSTSAPVAPSSSSASPSSVPATATPTSSASSAPASPTSAPTTTVTSAAASSSVVVLASSSTAQSAPINANAAQLTAVSVGVPVVLAAALLLSLVL